MRLVLRVVLLASAFVSPAASQTPAPQASVPMPAASAGSAATGTAVIRGTVVLADTGAPVRRVQVRAMSSDGQDNQVALTDEQGRYEITGLVGGRYNLTATRSGFVTVVYGQRRPGDRGTPLEIAPGTTTEKIAFAMPRGGVIAGHITDEFGEPLAEAMVQVLRSTFSPSGRRMMPMGRGDTTDDQGAFRIYGLNPGEYVVSATVRNGTFMTMPGGRPAPDTGQGYAPTYYPGTPAVSDAQRLTVAPGQELTGIAFGMTPTRVARISGRVIGGKPDEVEGFVMVEPEDRGGMNMMPGGPVRSDGSFDVSGVPPGRYVLRVQPRGPRDENALVGLVAVTVAGADLTNVIIPLQRPATIAGRIEFEGGQPPTGVPVSRVQVFANPIDPAGSRMFMTGPPRTADDGTFTIRGVSGAVLLRAGGAPGWYLKSVQYGGDDVTDTPITMRPGTDVSGVRIVMSQSTTTLSGSVRDDRGNAIVDAVVLVFPGDDAMWTPNSRFIRSARPDAQGKYEIKGLPPHQGYRIVAVSSLEDGQLYDPELLTGVRDRADRLTLGDAEAKSVDVRLRP